MDFITIKGQEHVKRGLEVAVAGKHNVMLIGTSIQQMRKLARASKSIGGGINIGIMLTCPCGNFTDPKKECRCKPIEIQRYLADKAHRAEKVDIHLEVPNLAYCNRRAGEASAEVKDRVERARLLLNRDKTSHCKIEPDMDKEADDLLKLAILELGISAKMYDKVVRVARTIAVLDNKDVIEPHHISEAISYRSLDRNIWS